MQIMKGHVLFLVVVAFVVLAVASIDPNPLTRTDFLRSNISESNGSSIGTNPSSFLEPGCILSTRGSTYMLKMNAWFNLLASSVDSSFLVSVWKYFTNLKLTGSKPTSSSLLIALANRELLSSASVQVGSI